MDHFGEFACGLTVLPDRSILIEQKLVENAKIEKFKCDILSDFQTMCRSSKKFFSQGVDCLKKHCSSSAFKYLFCIIVLDTIVLVLMY